MVNPQKIILDCDPGIDDALAIVFAHGHPGLEICGITTVAGNVGLELTTANALRVAELLGLARPVTAGSPGPLLPGPLRATLDARHAHGEDGLAGARLPPPATKPRDGHAVDYILAATAAAPGEITLVATGPLTNIALAVRRDPALVGRVRDFVIMGGSATRGNVTPAAEFNIGADPEAAAIVFGAGWRVTMVGLDVTLRARVRPVVLDRMRGMRRLADDLLLPCLARYGPDPVPVPQGARPGAGGGSQQSEHRGLGPGGSQQSERERARSGVAEGAGEYSPAADAGPAVHDVCALVRVVRPDLIGCVSARVDVETCGRLTAGMTVTDFRERPERRNALVATEIDAGGFWDVVIDCFARAAATVPAGAVASGQRTGM
jgi:purine nucleosidase